MVPVWSAHRTDVGYDHFDNGGTAIAEVGVPATFAAEVGVLKGATSMSLYLLVLP